MCSKNNSQMDKIIISQFDKNHSPSGAVSEMIKLLISEGLALDTLNREARISYHFYQYQHGYTRHSEEKNGF